MDETDPESLTNELPPTPENEEAVARVDGLLHEVGLEPDTIADRIKARLVLLGETTRTLGDEAASITMAREVFGVAEASGRPYSEEEKKTVLVGTLFTDIGKTGPALATEEQSKWVARMFGFNNQSPEVVHGSVRNFLDLRFPNEAEFAKAELSKMKLDDEGNTLDIDELTMRGLYNLHTTWTKQIIEGDGVPKVAIPAAVLHHHMRSDEDNPGGILNANGQYNGDYDSNHTFDRPEKLVSILDMYDAYTGRGGHDHETAMAKLRNWISETANGHYADDPDVAEILEDLNTAMLSPIPVG